MYRVGQKEADALTRTLLSGELFRYHIGGECTRFEARWAKAVGVRNCRMTSSGTTAITAALVGLGLGPGDEVVVPACTYMASAVSVLAVGAIPIVCDIDESVTLDPKALAALVGPRTRAVIPVHMWGLVCDLDAIMKVAKKHKLLVVEDCCQCVGGGYKGKSVGSVGHAGAFSFNYYKNMTAGEGGAFVTDDDAVARKGACMIDCCSFYWDGRTDFVPFTSNGSRASELEGAMMNAQLDRLPGMIKAMRKQKQTILEATADTGLKPIKANSLEWECGTHVGYMLPSPEQAERFAGLVGGFVTAKTGRHIYTEWDPIFAHQGAHHPALNPYNLRENAECRMDYTKDMCQRSLEILNRAVLIGTHPDRKAAETKALIKRVKSAATEVL
ncbi:aminotransferase class V-fold PLP-dependent enzyme [bacterium]|nr:aminotransferase class V-fold PLP-dependent enzyme [bacterium]